MSATSIAKIAKFERVLFYPSLALFASGRCIGGFAVGDASGSFRVSFVLLTAALAVFEWRARWLRRLQPRGFVILASAILLIGLLYFSCRSLTLAEADKRFNVAR